MPHTSSRYQQDLGFNDAYLLFTAETVVNGGGTQALTRNAAGDISQNIGASVTAIMDIPMSQGIISRTGFFEDTQNLFGSTFGGGLGGQAAGSGSAGTGVAGSAQPSPYRPDVIAGMASLQQITPRTALKLKGWKPIQMKVIYLITGAALTGHTIRVDKVVYANNVANAISSVLAVGANGLATATQANPYVTTISFAANQQVYQPSDLQSMWIELAPTTQAAGAYRFYGIEFQFEYNFN